MKNLVNDEDRVWAGFREAALDVWFICGLALCILKDQGTQLLTMPATDGRYLLPVCRDAAQAGHMDFEHGKTNLLTSLQWSKWQKELFCTCDSVLAIICSIPVL